MLTPVRNLNPKVGAGAFVAPSADLIGDVEIGARSSIWHRAVLRGDVMPIRIGDETNIQDGTVIHGTWQKAQAEIGSRVTVGHGAILHGCFIGDLVLIGMGSLVLDGARIPSRCVLGAGSLVTEGARFEEGWLIFGRPAKAIRKLRSEEILFLDQSADHYLTYMKWYQSSGEVS